MPGPRSSLLLALCACALPSHAAAAARVHSRPPTPAVQFLDNQRHLDVNRINLYVSNFGSFGYDVIRGGPGLYFPRGQQRSPLFAGGLWVGDQPNTRVTVAEYSSEYAPGRILSPGSPEPPASEGLQVYKVVR